MDYKKCASDIIMYIGGESNIVNVEHCSTRLRFNVADKGRVNQEKIKEIPGVLQVIVNSQVQVVVGNSVIEVYDELMKMITIQENRQTSSDEKKKIGKVVLEYLVAIFQPLIPAISGAGILKSILILLSTVGILDTSNTIYRVLMSISDATFYFMPMMVAITAATKLQINKLVALASVGVLLLPNMSTMLSEGVAFAGIGIKSVTYSSQVFPAILSTFFLAFMEKNLNKITPKVIRTFFVPMVSLAVTVPITLLFLGPLGYTLGEGLAKVIITLYSNFGFLAVAIVAFMLPLMVSTGMHKAMIPYVISSLGTLGYEILYNSASLAHNISESGACFAIALKSKDEQEKSVAATAGISALMGITEPALYGITLQNKVVLKAVMVSSGITGAFLGIVGLKAFVAVGPGLASITMFVDPANSMNIVYAFIGLVMSLFLSFIFTIIFWKKEQNDEDESKQSGVSAPTTVSTTVSNTEAQKVNIMNPMKGEVVALETVNDALFSQKALGEGVAVIPTKGELTAPCNGRIKMVFDTKHAIGMEADNGTELLFHIGINTVELGGKYYETRVKEGDPVKQGDVIATFDLDKIKNEGYDCTTPIIVTNSNEYTIDINEPKKANQSGLIMSTERKSS